MKSNRTALSRNNDLIFDEGALARKQKKKHFINLKIFLHTQID